MFLVCGFGRNEEERKSEMECGLNEDVRKICDDWNVQGMVTICEVWCGRSFVGKYLRERGRRGEPTVGVGRERG